MPQEILLSTSSSTEASILLHDLHTSNHIQSFRQSTSAQNGLTLNPSRTQFLAAQEGKGVIHTYAWGKDAVTVKMILPEKIRSLKLSPSGTWCIGGTETGKLFVWEVGSFKLHSDLRPPTGISYSQGKRIINLLHKLHLLLMRCWSSRVEKMQWFTHGDFWI